MTSACLSVVMPCFNERATLLKAVERVLESPFTAELIIVDDGSHDGSGDLAASVADPRVRVLRHQRNRGKGAALRTGFAAATAPYVIVQDADLECDPADYAVIVPPLLHGEADVVYGSRFIRGHSRRVVGFRRSILNRTLTFVSNIFTDLDLTDMETCYKAFRREVIQSLDLQEDRFGFEPEVTAKVAKAQLRVYEVAVSYDARDREAGKKIGWRDGLRALYSIVRYSVLDGR